MGTETVVVRTYITHTMDNYLFRLRFCCKDREFMRYGCKNFHLNTEECEDCTVKSEYRTDTKTWTIEEPTKIKPQDSRMNP